MKEHIQLDVFVHALLVSTSPNATISQSSSTFHVRNLRNLHDFIKDHRTQSVLDYNTIKRVVYGIRKVSKLNESEVNPYKWLLKPAVALGAILLVYTFWTLSGGNPYGRWTLVTRVVDGDTVHVGRGWRNTTVRFLGVDTPETVHPDKPVEFLGPEASEFTKKTLKGEKVHLEFKPLNQGDNYSRLLAYVYLSDGTLFNAELIKRGYARAIAPFNFRYYDEFQNYEREARAAGVGIWSTKAETLQVPSGVSGKVIGNKRSKIYHLPGQASYHRIEEKNRVYFNSAEEAVKAGYRKAKK